MKLAIVGAGGHGRVVADAASLDGDKWSEIVFFDDLYPELKNNGLYSVVGSYNHLLQSIPDFDGVIVAIGNNVIRAEFSKELTELNAPLATIIHPRAVIGSECSIGTGSVILANAVVNSGCVIGDAVIVNTAAIVDHDCILRDGVHISPGANLAGQVTVGHNSWVGIGASVKQLVNVDCNCIVGAGAAVVADVLNGQTVVGIPAKPI